MISCFGHGIGGHYYSLKTTADAVSEFSNVFIVSVGTTNCPLFSDLPNYHSIITKQPSIKNIIQLCRFIDENRIDVIHSFDEHIYLFSRIASLIKGCKIIHTKCGGLLPGRFFPSVDNIVVYSNEDEKYFLSHKKFKKARVHFIPNRVFKINVDYESISKIKSMLPSDLYIFLRISRFSGLHEKSIIASIELIRRLSSLGKPVQLVIIGVIQDKEVYERIKSALPDNVFFETRPEYTVNATRLIELADFVIGTGRGAMEAIVHGIPLLSPVKDSETPIFVQPETVQKFLSFNFSERTELEESDLSGNYAKLLDVIDSKEILNDYLTKMSKFSEEYFEIKSALGKYKNLYANLPSARFTLIDLMLHFIKVYRFYRINYRKDIGF